MPALGRISSRPQGATAAAGVAAPSGVGPGAAELAPDAPKTAGLHPNGEAASVVAATESDIVIHYNCGEASGITEELTKSEGEFPLTEERKVRG